MTLENPALAAMDKYLDETADEENYEKLVEICLARLMRGESIAAKVEGRLHKDWMTIDGLHDDYEEFTLMVLRGKIDEAKAFLKDQIETRLRARVETWYDEIMEAENI